MITFSTCWYTLKAKFDVQIYKSWINNMLSNVNNYYLVVYTDNNGKNFIEPYLSNPNIKMVIKPINKFYNWKYKEFWERNHVNNYLLNRHTDWQVNMLWSEKTAFVKETAQNNYFSTELFGWCDIGYFRNRGNKDLSTSQLTNWPSHEKLKALNPDKIHYACINNNNTEIAYFMHWATIKDSNGLPVKPIPPNQTSIAGGFFILHKSKVDEWQEEYDNKLQLYFANKYLVKDDQIILADLIFSDMQRFSLHKERFNNFDNWFLFQRVLF